jgi:hypothetical protein
MLTRCCCRWALSNHHHQVHFLLHPQEETGATDRGRGWASPACPATWRTPSRLRAGSTAGCALRRARRSFSWWLPFGCLLLSIEERFSSRSPRKMTRAASTRRRRAQHAGRAAPPRYRLTPHQPQATALDLLGALQFLVCECRSESVTTCDGGGRRSNISKRAVPERSRDQESGGIRRKTERHDNLLS